MFSEMRKPGCQRAALRSSCQFCQLPGSIALIGSARDRYRRQKDHIQTTAECVICGTAGNLTKCAGKDCPYLLCSIHVRRYGGRCRNCWNTGAIILPPKPTTQKTVP
jgi:hypothetical protein